MNERDRKQEEQLARLFEAAGAAPMLTPDPSLPMRIRALAASGAPRAGRDAARRRWARVSLASAALVLSIVAGGYIGYRAWATQPVTTDSTDDAGILVTAWLQDGFVEELGEAGSDGNEVKE